VRYVSSQKVSLGPKVTSHVKTSTMTTKKSFKAKNHLLETKLLMRRFLPAKRLTVFNLAEQSVLPTFRQVAQKTKKKRFCNYFTKNFIVSIIKTLKLAKLIDATKQLKFSVLKSSFFIYLLLKSFELISGFIFHVHDERYWTPARKTIFGVRKTCVTLS